MKRLLRTVAYWLRFFLWPSSVSWTARDNDAWETEVWKADGFQGYSGGDL